MLHKGLKKKIATSIENGESLSTHNPNGAEWKKGESELKVWIQTVWNTNFHVRTRFGRLRQIHNSDNNKKVL